MLKIIFVLYVLVFIGSGLFLIAVSRDFIFSYESFIARPAFRPPAAELLKWGGSLFGVGLLTAIVKVIELRRARYVAFDNPDGEVAIPLRTIEEFVRRVGGEVDGVVSLKPRIEPHRRSGVEVTLEVVLEEGVNVPQLTETVQHRIKTQLQKLLGIENIAAIQVNVLRIKPRTGAGEV